MSDFEIEIGPMTLRWEQDGDDSGVGVIAVETTGSGYLGTLDEISRDEWAEIKAAAP